MNKYFVYILKSDLGYTYIGQTSNLEDRLNRHNTNRSTYTANKGHWNLIASVALVSRSEAVQLEKKLKGFKNSDKAISYLKNFGLEHPDLLVGRVGGSTPSAPTELRATTSGFFMNKYFVYILKSDLGYTYIGQTSNLEDRLNRHNTNRSTYTANKGHWNLIASAALVSRSEAVQLEKKLKGFKNSDKAISYLKNFGLEHPDLLVGRVGGPPEADKFDSFSPHQILNSSNQIPISKQNSIQKFKFQI